MPLIAGGIYKSESARVALERLTELTKKRIQNSQQSFYSAHSSEGCALIAGQEELESSSQSVRLLADNASIMIGRLFEKQGDFKTVETADINVSTINETKGAFLSDHYWGNYLLASVSADKQSIYLYRDPQGHSTVFYMHIPGGVLFASHIELLYDAVEQKPDYNWDYLASYVSVAHNMTASTPFQGVTELLPGCRVELSVGRQLEQHSFWRPTDIQAPFIGNEKQYTERLYDTFKACTAAWVRDSKNIYVELSGGLDSSSLFSVLKDVMPAENALTGVNILHSDVASSDERKYAQNVADLCNAPLKIFDWTDALPFSDISNERRFNRPTSFLGNKAFDEKLAAVMPLTAEDEVICGQGGDHMFLAPPPVECIADFLLQGNARGLGAQISAIAAYHRMPYVRVLSKSLKTIGQYAVGNLGYLPITATYEAWMTDAFKKHVTFEQFRPAFWNNLKKVHPAKAHHIFAIYQASHYIDRGYRIPGKPVINPFLSQPLVELALTMPAYQSHGDGYNRVLFRRAIASHKKGDFIWRNSKGETSGVMVLAVRKHFNTLSDFLLNGQFVKRGLVDKDTMYAQLQEIKHGKTTNMWPFLNLYVAELWLNSWNRNLL